MNPQTLKFNVQVLTGWVVDVSCFWTWHDNDYVIFIWLVYLMPSSFQDV